jgi:hypothetical protein
LKGKKMNEQTITSPIKKCQQCGRLLPQAALSCFSCGSYEFRDAETPAGGKVYSFTTIRVPPEGFNDNKPYNVVVVEIEGGARILAIQTEGVEGGVSINETVNLKLGPTGLLTVEKS